MKTIQETFGRTSEIRRDTLSFIQGCNFWAPERSGSYSQDCDTGRFYARELLAFIRLRQSPALLRHVCEAMACQEFGGVETGFFHVLSESLIDSAA